MKEYIKNKYGLKLRRKRAGKDVIVADLWGLDNPTPYYEKRLRWIKRPFVDNPAWHPERFAVIAIDRLMQYEVDYLADQGALFDLDTIQEEWEIESKYM